MAAGSGSTNPPLDRDPHSASPSRRETDNSAETAAKDLCSPVVLLVEDNETDVFIITEVLERAGFRFRLHVSRDGQAALSYLQDLERIGPPPRPDLVLLDLNIPKINGIEVLERIRSAVPHTPVPVVVITSSESQSDRRAVERLGADAYFRKPNNIEEYMRLASLVARFLPAP